MISSFLPLLVLLVDVTRSEQVVLQVVGIHRSVAEDMADMLGVAGVSIDLLTLLDTLNVALHAVNEDILGEVVGARHPVSDSVLLGSELKDLSHHVESFGRDHVELTFAGILSISHRSSVVSSGMG